VGGAALLTIALPFHEFNPEITSRTFPTALDLLIAIFVAVAAVASAVRTNSDSASTAAGTAIGIALIPPLCVVGLGLGIRDFEVAQGATMLFVTNLTAILFVSVVSFWALDARRGHAGEPHHRGRASAPAGPKAPGGTLPSGPHRVTAETPPRLPDPR
ncbi:MAG: DUF389 domain-containing protein, partial [Gemmatimonadetes bacterium]|nr:DUF389 domain-containing protein [Gemmatimonadota bacterium]